MKITCSIDTSKLERALRDWAALTHKGANAVMIEAARGVVKRVVAITPPAQGRVAGTKKDPDSAAIRVGEKAVRSDLKKLFIPILLKGKRPDQWPDLAALHDANRNHQGRVRDNCQRYHVDQAKLAALIKVLTARVGFLAAGWNASAQKLGVNLPAWIRRHGTGSGSAEIVISNRGISITLRNKVKYADNVDGYNRHVQAAVNYQTAATERRVKFMAEKAARQAGVR